MNLTVICPQELFLCAGLNENYSNPTFYASHALQIKEKKAHRACAFNLGAAYVEAGKPQKGLDFLRKAQPGERRERVADLQYNLGVAHEALGDQAQAAGHYFQAAQLYRSQGDGSSEGDTCLKLARCHIRMKVIHLTFAHTCL